MCRKSITRQLHVDDRRVATAEIADTPLRRARGMLARSELPEALLLQPCGSVHGMGMRTALDVAFLDRTGTVLAVVVLRPWSPPKGRRGAISVLEAPTGSFERWGLTTGSRITTS